MAYCEICGKETNKEWTGFYDKETGEKKYRDICSVNPCEHSGHLFGDIEFSKPSFFFANTTSTRRCYRCNYVEKNILGD